MFINLQLKTNDIAKQLLATFQPHYSTQHPDKENADYHQIQCGLKSLQLMQEICQDKNQQLVLQEVSNYLEELLTIPSFLKATTENCLLVKEHLETVLIENNLEGAVKVIITTPTSKKPEICIKLKIQNAYSGIYYAQLREEDRSIYTINWKYFPIAEPDKKSLTNHTHKGLRNLLKSFHD